MSHHSLLAPAPSRYLLHHHLEILTTMFYGVHYCICTFMNGWSCTSRLSTMIYRCSLKNSMLIPEKVFLREYYRESLGMYPLRTCNFQLLYQQHISYINLVCINYSKWRGCLLHPLTQSQKRPLPIPGFIPSFNMNCITIELTCNPR
jgi:hypothetical protein